MASKAFVLIETAVGKTKEAYIALEKLDAVQSVDAVTGPYDIIVTVEEDDLNSIGNLITNKIHSVTGVIRTVTCICLKIS